MPTSVSDRQLIPSSPCLQLVVEWGVAMLSGADTLRPELDSRTAHFFFIFFRSRTYEKISRGVKRAVWSRAIKALNGLTAAPDAAFTS